MHQPIARIRLVCAIAAAFAAFPLSAATEVVAGVVVVRGTFVPGSQPDGNTTILESPDGLVVIDTGRHAAHTQAIIDFARERGRPIAAVINTHWHLDHIGGNLRIRETHPQVRVYAGGALHDALQGFLRRYRDDLVKMIETAAEPAKKAAWEAEVRLIDAGAKLGPDVELTATAARSIGGRELTLGVEKRAVTAADVWVLDANRGVLVAGDLITLPVPFFDTACAAGWAASLDRLAALRFDVVVPGHGAPMTRTQFERYRDAFDSLLECAGSDAAAEQCIDGWMRAVAALAPDTDAKFARSLMAYYVGVLRDREREALRCAGD